MAQGAETSHETTAHYLLAVLARQLKQQCYGVVGIPHSLEGLVSNPLCVIFSRVLFIGWV
jgi:hypothetical protein